MKKGKWLIALLSFFAIIIIISEIAAIIVVHNYRSDLTFRLEGEERIVLQLGEDYVEPGYTATSMQMDLGDRVQVENNIDSSILGKYYVKYTLDFLNRRYDLERTIEVIDVIPPIITLNGDAEISIYTDDEYIDPGATAGDNYDGDITDRIVINNELDNTYPGEYRIVYSVEDSSGNSADITRKIIVEKKPEPEPEPEPEIAYVPVQSDDTEVVVPTTSSDPIADYISEHGYDASVGYYNLATGRQYLYQADRIYYGASLIKTLDAIYLYDKGMVDDNLKYYIDRAISVSDNNAHLYLINYIGKDNLKNYGIALGAPNTLSGDNSYGDTTVMDQLAYYKKAYEIASSNADFKAPFINDYYNYIKIDGITTMHKHGYYDQWYHDAGIVFDTEPYIVVILTNHGKGNRYEVIHNLTNLIYKYHKGE